MQMHDLGIEIEAVIPVLNNSRVIEVAIQSLDPLVCLACPLRAWNIASELAAPTSGSDVTTHHPVTLEAEQTNVSCKFVRPEIYINRVSLAALHLQPRTDVGTEPVAAFKTPCGIDLDTLIREP